MNGLTLELERKRQSSVYLYGCLAKIMEIGSKYIKFYITLTSRGTCH